MQCKVATLQDEVFELPPGEAVPVIEPSRLVLLSSAPEPFDQLQLVGEDLAISVGPVLEDRVVTRAVDVRRPVRVGGYDVAAVPGKVSVSVSSCRTKRSG